MAEGFLCPWRCVIWCLDHIASLLSCSTSQRLLWKLLLGEANSKWGTYELIEYFRSEALGVLRQDTSLIKQVLERQLASPIYCFTHGHTSRILPQKHARQERQEEGPWHEERNHLCGLSKWSYMLCCLGKPCLSPALFRLVHLSQLGRTNIIHYENHLNTYPSWHNQTGALITPTFQTCDNDLCWSHQAIDL